MKIGVLSDTHIPWASKELPDKVFEIFKDVILIVHAGDLIVKKVLQELQIIAPVIAVHGNQDSDELKLSLPEQKIFELEGFRIGVLHGHGNKGTTLDRLPTFFAGENLNCIIFGHSHIPFNKFINNTLYFNPGSPTNKRRQRFFSVGLLTIDKDIHGEIIYF